MPLITKINEDPIAVKHENIYPCIMKLTNGDMFVLFSEAEKGTVLWEKNTSRCVGEVCNDFYMPFFRPYYGEVTLCQSK